jgi:sugar-specific transcriptional regulator TrmB
MKESDFKILGLNSYEIKVFLALIKKGKQKASDLSKESSVPNGKIYETLHILEEKGLIQVIPESIKLYVARPLTHLKELVQEKIKELNSFTKDIDEFKEVHDQQINGEVVLVRGKNNFHRIIKDIPSSKTFSYGIKWSANITDFNIQKSMKKAKDRKINSRVLYGYDTPKENIEKLSKINPDHKFIDTQGIALAINDDSVMISDVSLNSTVLFKSENFSKVMKQLFEGYWENKK